MSKQEVVDLITVALTTEYRHGSENVLTKDRPIEKAEALYDRITPLREFPEEEVKGLIARSRLRDENQDLNIHSLEEVADWFKHLWEGWPDIIDEALSKEYAGMEAEQPKEDANPLRFQDREGDNILEQPCQTCGGSRKVPLGTISASGYKPRDCPDCTGEPMSHDPSDGIIVRGVMDGKVMDAS